jgi:hypothetical protein
MSITVTGKIAEQDYTPKNQIDKPNPAIFRLKALNTIEYMDVIDSMSGANFTAESLQKIAKYSFISATNLVDENNKPAELNVETLPPMIVLELSNQVLDMSTVVDAEKKI